MIAFPNCKINLGLNILARREDGFHELNTLFYPLSLSDCLEIIPNTTSDEFSFSSSGIFIPSDGSKNICEKAFDLLKESYPVPGVKMHLHKKIPIGAGLGGGSSDAAHTLLLLKSLFDLPITGKELKAMVAKLGSDCAFFIENTPAIATGRGEKLHKFTINLGGRNLALVVPPIHISTAEAYAGIQPREAMHEISHVATRSIEKWEEMLVNDFEDSIFPKHPRIKEIKEQLYSMGAEYASMSGSGSAVFGIFKEEITPRTLQENFSNDFVWSEVLKT